MEFDAVLKPLPLVVRVNEKSSRSSLPSSSFLLACVGRILDAMVELEHRGSFVKGLCPFVQVVLDAMEPFNTPATLKEPFFFSWSEATAMNPHCTLDVLWLQTM